ncbi:hypothetical protein GGX14DRAFT_474370 [Mycena pura]|uniref:Uncharacterized protein n=1 Tax=Mycena pura TaxID=153505 RepID=A0AAD6UZM2_9AGAR|nr:hypothetical protein GGX14DRAFT_474370 [Mycena pura]
MSHCTSSPVRDARSFSTSPMLSWLLNRPFLSLLVAGCPAYALSMNTTIDDTDTTHFTWPVGNVTVPEWAAASVAHPCGYCSAQPGNDSSANITNETWHDGHVGSAAWFTFRGSAVYIFGIDIARSANISFSLDGGPATFHQYPGPEQFAFNARFFSAAGLPAGPHNVSWVLMESATNGTSALFDYAVVTSDTDGTLQAGSTSAGAGSSQSMSGAGGGGGGGANVGALVGGLLGGLAVVAWVAIALLVLRRRRARNGAASTGTGIRWEMRSVYSQHQPSVAGATQPDW